MDIPPPTATGAATAGRPERGPRPGTPNRLLSIVLGALLVGLTLYLWRPGFGVDPTGTLHYPAESAGRMFDRHLELFFRIDREPAWRVAMLEFVYGSREETLASALAAYRDVLEHFERHPARATQWTERNTRARLLILLGETGRLDAATPELLELDESLEGAVVADTLRFAWLATPTDWSMAELMLGLRLLPEGWVGDTVRMRIADRLGDTGWRDWAAGRLESRAQRLREQSLLLVAVTACLLSAGALVLATWLWRGVPRSPWRARALETPWSMEDGLGVTVRAATAGLLVLLLLRSPYSPFETNLLVLWSTLFASLPMIWLMRRYLLRPRNWGFSDALGLRLSGVSPGLLAGTVLVLVALDTGGSMLIGWGTWELGVRPHWSEGLDETWVWSTPVKRYLSGVDAAVWSPLFEEIGFRGLLYLSLRSRLRPVPAALLTATLFGALHIHSLAGFLTVFWSALVWSWAFERFRSLLPGILAHTTVNLLAIHVALAFYT